MTIWLTDQHPEFTDWSPVCMSFHYNFLAKERVRDCWLQTYDVNNLMIGSKLEKHLKLVDILAHLCYLIRYSTGASCRTCFHASFRCQWESPATHLHMYLTSLGTEKAHEGDARCEHYDLVWIRDELTAEHSEGRNTR